MSSFPLEGRPSQMQKARLSQFMEQLQRLCDHHGFLIDTDDDDVAIVDLFGDTAVGIGLVYLLDATGHEITALDCTGSILDGSWLVDSPNGPIEQRELRMD